MSVCTTVRISLTLLSKTLKRWLRIPFQLREFLHKQPNQFITTAITATFPFPLLLAKHSRPPLLRSSPQLLLFPLLLQCRPYFGYHNPATTNFLLALPSLSAPIGLQPPLLFLLAQSLPLNYRRHVPQLPGLTNHNQLEHNMRTINLEDFVVIHCLYPPAWKKMNKEIKDHVHENILDK